MPDHTSHPTPDLDALIERWTHEVGASEPRLAPHLDELADHLRGAVEADLAAGVELEVAFVRAIEGFGDPREVACEYAKADAPWRRLLGWLADKRNERRAGLALSTAWIAMSLGWAGAMVSTDLVVSWMLVGWFATTFGPLTALDLGVKRIRSAR